MGFWISMLLADLLFPVLMLVGGWLMANHSAAHPNRFTGYRTPWSKKSVDTWIYANRTCGKIWMVLGAVTLVPTILVHLPFLHSSEDTIGVLVIVVEIVLLVIMLAPVVYVEYRMRQLFDKNGNPK